MPEILNLYTKEQILEILDNESKYLENHANNYGKLSDSFKIIELLLLSIRTNKSLQDRYIVSVTYKNEVIMTIGCFVNKKKRYQTNNFITKHFSKKDIPKNIAMYLHSYCAYLFDSKYIMIKEPLDEMKRILLTSIENCIDINDVFDYELEDEEYKHYIRIHEDLLKDTYKNITIHEICDGSDTIFIRNTDSLKKLWKQSRLVFSFTKI